MLSHDNQSEASNASWIKIVTKYSQPDHVKSWRQFSVNLLFYSILWYLMFLGLSVSYWITLGLSLPAAGMLVRLFIIYHDCGHGSFFRSQKLGDTVGVLLGILTFTPYHHWTKNHQVHHDTAGNLDKRGTGDVWTMTVDEFTGSSRWTRIQYRFYRHPVTMFLVGAPYVFIIGNRFTKRYMSEKSRMSVYVTNLGVAAYIAALCLLIGVKAFILIQLPVICLAGIGGFWLFYVQHQFEPTYWSRNGEWDYRRMALEGSSFYKLPAIFNYFSGNIGFHHIHHLGPRIPNYRLARCHRENPLFSAIKPLTFAQSLRTLTYRLWDEQARKLISFRKLRQRGV